MYVCQGFGFYCVVVGGGKEERMVGEKSGRTKG